MFNDWQPLTTLRPLSVSLVRSGLRVMESHIAVMPLCKNMNSRTRSLWMVRFISRLTLLLLPSDCRTFLAKSRPSVIPGNLRHSVSGRTAITVEAIGNGAERILLGSIVTVCSNDGSELFSASASRAASISVSIRCRLAEKSSNSAIWSVNPAKSFSAAFVSVPVVSSSNSTR